MDELKKQIAELIEQMKEKFEKQQKELVEHGQLSETLSTEMKELKSQHDTLVKELQEKIQAHEQKLIELGRLPNAEKKSKLEDFGFKSLGEFIHAALKNRKANPHDDRLAKVNDWMAEQEMKSEGAAQGFAVPPALNFRLNRKELSFGTDAEGGYLIPDLYGAMLKMFEAQAGIFRPRATVVPAGSPPDALIKFPALDQSGAKGVYSGVQVSWISEGESKPETDYTVREIELQPQEVAAFMTVTDKLLRNSAAASALINSLLRKAVLAAEDQAFYNGSGSGQPLGVLGHASTINVTRVASNQVSYTDIVNMYARIVFGGSYIFLANQTVLPQLMTMADSGGNLIWRPNKDAIGGNPGTLLGVPVVINQRSAALGSDGDIGLLDLSYYYIKDGSGIIVASSEHVEFKKNKTLVKITWNVDGKPSITTPLTLEDGSSTASPFVFLDADITS
jgi:HK97 family phage major capsid protein